MIEQQITLCSNGRAVLSGYSGGLLLGYAHNTDVYRLRVVCSGEWDGTTVVAFWHLPGPAEPLTTLVADGAVEVPALVTAQGGSGTVTFEGSDGTRTVTSASVPYRVLSNSGTTDPTLPEPGTPAWQQFLQQVKRELRNAAAGLSDEERGLILALFRHAVYDNGEMLPHYNALAALWSGSSLPDVPPAPSQPEKPSTSLTVPGETAVYELTTPTVFKTAEKKYIDTGVKLFADISAQPTWTILLDSTDFASLKGLASSAALFHCGTSDDSNIRVIAWKNGGVYFNLYGVDTQLGWWVGSSSAYLRMCLQIRGNQYKLSYDTTEGSWTNIPNYSANIDATLLLGAYREDNGTIGRFWEGNLNKFAVYNKLLTDEQIKTFMEAK